MTTDVLDVRYPGVIAPLSCVVYHGQGLTPSRAVIEMEPQEYAPLREGTLELQDGGRLISLPRMRVDKAQLGQDQAGYYTRVVLVDRRWRFRFGGISGAYNLPRADGSIDPGTAIDAQQLAQLLFTLMGETGAVTTALPQDLPYAYWPVKNCHAGLQWLLSRYGYDVVWDWINDRMVVVARGVGTPFPKDDDSEQEMPSFDQAERPSSLRVVGGPDTYQTKLQLEAVGMDVDGELKPLALLSYAPTGGWNASRDPLRFADISNAASRSLARDSVFRVYRIKGQATSNGANWNLPFGRFDTAPIQSLSDILPLHSTLLQAHTDSTGRYLRQPFVEGTFVPSRNYGGGVTGQPGAAVVDFELRRRSGLCLFKTPMVRLNANGFEPADLTLTASYNVTRNQLPWAPSRDAVLDLAAGTAPFVEHHPEIQRGFAAAYQSGTNFKAYASEQSNFAETAVAMQATLSAMAFTFQDVQGELVRYRRLKPFTLDGARRQIVWRVDVNQGASTTAYANTEGANGIKSLAERRLAARLVDDSQTLDESYRYGGVR